MVGLAELAAALPDYEEAESYYEGCVSESFSSKAIARALRYSRDLYKINFAKTPVNAVADKLVVTAVTATTGDVIDDETTQAIEKQILKPNRTDELFGEILRRMCEYGDAYAFVWPSVDPVSQLANGGVTIYYNSPKTTRVIYDPFNPTIAAYGIKAWRDMGKRHHAVLYYRMTVQTWDAKPGTSGDQAEHWAMAAEVPNPYGRLPLFHFRTATPYGVPEHKAGYGAQAAIDKASVVMMHSTEAMGFAQRWALSDPQAALSGGTTDDPVWDDDAHEYEENKDDTALTSGPGELWTLDGVKEIGEFAAAQPGGFLAVLAFFIRAMAQVTETPLHYFDAQDATRTGSIPSGAAQREADKPLNDKAAKRKTSSTATLQDMMLFACLVVGLSASQVDIRWAPLVTIDDPEGWAVVEAKIACGVPQRQALLEAGYTADQVDEWLDAPNEEMDLGRRITLLGQVSEALGGIGQAVALGVLTPEQAQAIATGILGALAPSVDGGPGVPALPPAENVPADNDLIIPPPAKVPVPVS